MRKGLTLNEIKGRELTFRSFGSVLTGPVRELIDERTVSVGAFDEFGLVECIVSIDDFVRVGSPSF